VLKADGCAWLSGFVR